MEVTGEGGGGGMNVISGPKSMGDREAQFIANISLTCVFRLKKNFRRREGAEQHQLRMTRRAPINTPAETLNKAA